jgi:hypothetical protein
VIDPDMLAAIYARAQGACRRRPRPVLSAVTQDLATPQRRVPLPIAQRQCLSALLHTQAHRDADDISLTVSESGSTAGQYDKDSCWCSIAWD